MRRFFSSVLILLVSFSAALADDRAPAPASSISTNDYGDPLLKAMLGELRRSQDKLQLGQMQRPYYIDYQVTAIDDYIADATLGALRNETHHAGRLVRVVVRIGDYKQDSYFGEGTGSVEVLPVEDNELALRRQLWLATDKAYKAALTGLTEKQAALKNVEADKDLFDFSQEKPSAAVVRPATLGVNLNDWKQRIRAVSDLFRADPSLESSSAGLHFRVLNRYLVNTEGTVTRSGTTVYTVTFDGSTQAADGMRIERSHAYVVARPEELPKPEEMATDAKQLIATFSALRTAPLVEDNYRGPVLFSADTASALFERLVAPNILGVRPELGNPARTRGEFSSSYKGRVLPEFFTVVDDPHAGKVGDVSLSGDYDVDDEGVKAQTVTVVDKGTLSNFLIGREPVRDFPSSNGHGRMAFAGAPRPQISNLIFRANGGLSPDELKKKLIQMCKDQGRPYGYFVETTGPRLAPRLLWRVYASDGHMELVRGAVFNQLDMRSIRNNIVAAGNDAYVYNRSEPLPSAIVAPSLLFDELEIQRANRTREKLPSYPAPPLSSH
ncbi:MAG TPA: metallopeptidase TldD-related protein [Candidatus Angelobacter sp.]|nr:metallopeptidase TldD-related protein [Candidatus Angelobacter sp.]